MRCKLLFIIVFSLTSVLVAENRSFLWRAEETADKLIVTVEVGEGAYLFRVDLSASDAENSDLTPIERPKVISRSTSLQGELAIYPTGTHKWVFSGKAPFKLTASYQGCRNDICFLPAEYLYPQAQIPSESVNFRKFEGLANSQQFLAFLENSDTVTKYVAPDKVSWGWIGLILLGGLALNLTPCILPMIPVTLSIIGVGKEKKARSGFFLGLLYGGGLAAAYGILGILAVTAGMRLGSINGSPIFNWVIALVFCYLGLAMLGYLPFDLSRLLPDKWLRRLDNEGGSLLAQGIIAFVFGVIGALLAGACVAPVVAGVLLFATQQYVAGEPMAIFWPLVLGVGMALPWPFVGAGLKILPKPGKFTLWIKYVFGAIILACAVYFALQGWTLRSHQFKVWVELRNLAEAQHRSQNEDKPLLVYFGASWCKNCTAMEIGTLNDPVVKEKLKDFVFCKFRAEELDEVSVKRVLDFYQISGLPAFVIENEK